MDKILSVLILGLNGMEEGLKLAKYNTLADMSRDIDFLEGAIQERKFCINLILDELKEIYK